MTLKELLDAGAVLEKEATPGPWRYDVRTEKLYANGEEVGDFGTTARDEQDRDGLLCAWLRNNWEHVRRIIEKQQAVVEWVRRLPHQGRCETFRVLGDPCGRTSLYRDEKGNPVYESTGRKWSCFCGRDAALAALDAELATLGKETA